ncbi:MAG: hypothetical protein L6416_00580, partial [Candidatus Omnitrophica bacterium]|nr:hypothetical protein [Candidatus Omnitrophota bacterium]
MIICICLGVLHFQAVDSYALLDTQKHTLSPAVSINQPYIKAIIGNLKNTNITINTLARKATPLFIKPESLGLDERSDLIIKRCLRNDFSLLMLNWNKKHYDYPQFIKEAAAVNQALLYLIYAESPHPGMDYTLFMKKAISIRIEMIMRYQAPLSEKGAKRINFIKRSSADLNLLQKVMKPPKEWFVPLFDAQRAKVLFAECNPPLEDNGIYNPAPFTPRIITTWGCSTQCDHCDGGSVIEVTSFPWIWMEESQTLSPRYISKIKQEPNINDYFRDYYDFVYDKDASDVIMFMGHKLISTSGFAPGSVGERALKKLLTKNHIKAFQVSVAPSAWMRSVIHKSGVQEYIDYLSHIKSIIKNYNRLNADKYEKLTFVFAVFDFTRIDDDPEIFRKIFDFCYRENNAKINSTIWEIGNFNRINKAGIIDSDNVLSRTSALRNDASAADRKKFLTKEVANTA